MLPPRCNGLSRRADAAGPESVRRLKDWEEEIVCLDRKEAEVRSDQWQLLREQTATLICDLKLLRSEVHCLKAGQETMRQSLENFQDLRDSLGVGDLPGVTRRLSDRIRALEAGDLGEGGDRREELQRQQSSATSARIEAIELKFSEFVARQMNMTNLMKEDLQVNRKDLETLKEMFVRQSRDELKQQHDNIQRLTLSTTERASPEVEDGASEWRNVPSNTNVVELEKRFELAMETNLKEFHSLKVSHSKACIDFATMSGLPDRIALVEKALNVNDAKQAKALQDEFSGFVNEVISQVETLKSHVGELHRAVNAMQNNQQFFVREDDLKPIRTAMADLSGREKLDRSEFDKVKALVDRLTRSALRSGDSPAAGQPLPQQNRR